MPAPVDQLLLSPLGEATQHLPGSSIDADRVLLSPDLKTNQDHADIQLHVDLNTQVAHKQTDKKNNKILNLLIKILSVRFVYMLCSSETTSPAPTTTKDEGERERLQGFQ